MDVLTALPETDNEEKVFAGIRNKVISQQLELVECIADLDNNVTHLLKTFNRESQRQELWTHIVDKDKKHRLNSAENSAHMAEVFLYIKEMALAYRHPKSRFFADDVLRRTLFDAMDWMYRHRYHENIATIYDNWYHWDIAIPQTFGETLILLYDELSNKEIQRYTCALDNFNPHPKIAVGIFNNIIHMTAGNLIDKALAYAYRGVISSSAEHMDIARDSLSETFEYVTEGDGFYVDGSFIQHESIPYAGGYGATVLKKLNSLQNVISGTPFEVTDPRLSHVYNWLTDAFQPLFFKGAIMDMVRGRSIAWPEATDRTAAKGMLIQILKLAETAPEGKKRALKAFVKAQMMNEHYCGEYRHYPPFNALISDKSVKPEENVWLHKTFAAMDRVVYHRPEYAFGISMYSIRIASFEYGNGANTQGWYTSAGAVYFYNSDTGYYSEAFWPTVDMLRLPGTTVDGTKGRVEAWAKHYSRQDFVGGVSLKGRYGATAMAFDTEQSSLTGKKSWFAFGNELVALGTDIRSDDKYAVETIIENRKSCESSSKHLAIDGERQLPEPGEQVQLSGINWAYLKESSETGSGSIGYVFPQPMEIELQHECREGCWCDIHEYESDELICRNYLSLAVQHGIQPQEASYSYVLLPERTKTEVAEYSQNPDIEILRNDAEIQAVKSRSTDLTGIVFWQQGALGNIEAQTPMVMMFEGKGHMLTIAVSDPTHKQAQIEFIIERDDLKLVQQEAGICVVQERGKTKVVVNTKGALGKTFEFSFLRLVWNDEPLMHSYTG